jgi:hypothetical protein
MRQCGDCSICCIVGAVPELKKDAHTPCPFISTCSTGSCSVFNSPILPTTCKDYDCAWKQGWGAETDRPKENDVLFTSNILEGQKFLTAIELKPFAIEIGGKNMAIEMVASTKVPMIVVLYGKKPPHDTGDYVIVHDEILPRCQRIVGEFKLRMSDKVAMYKLVKGR